MKKNIKGISSYMNNLNATITGYLTLLIVLIICIIVISIGGLYLHTSAVSELQNKVYLIDGSGAVISATAQDQSVTRKDEITHQVRTFHELMFNLPPSGEMIKRNLERAFEMADISAYRYYNDLQETGFYKRLTGTNSYQQIDIQSIDVDMDSYPYAVSVMAYQYITRESNITQYTLRTRCRVANAVRSLNNLHGLMIEGFEVIENNYVETRNK